MRKIILGSIVTANLLFGDFGDMRTVTADDLYLMSLAANGPGWNKISPFNQDETVKYSATKLNNWVQNADLSYKDYAGFSSYATEGQYTGYSRVYAERYIDGVKKFSELKVQNDLINLQNNNNNLLMNDTNLLLNFNDEKAYLKATNLDLNLLYKNSTTNNYHGLTINDTRTILSGGTQSSYLSLDDTGARFYNGSNAPIIISGVANAVADYDAVNLKQLNDTLQSSKDYTDLIFSSATGGGSSGVSESLVDTKDAETLSNAKIYADTKDAETLSNAKSYADDGDAKTLKEANSYTDSKISALEESLTKEYRSATATAIALAVSPILNNGNKHALGIGLGHYEGQNAVAVNYVAEVNKSVHIQLGTALNSNSQSFKGGVSFGF